MTLREVAEHAGVSIATVSYVLSGAVQDGARYSDETAERVRNAASELRYVPNRMARSVRTGRTGVVQLVLHMLGDPWTLSLAEAFATAGPARGWTTLIAADTEFVDALTRSEFDAAFVAATGAADPAGWSNVLGPLARKVAVYSPDLEPDRFDVVRFDERRASRLAVEHLLAQRSRVGMLATRTPDGRPRSNVRRQTYLEVMREAGLSIPEAYVAEYEKSLLDPYRAARVLLGGPDRPDAVFAEADFAAFAALNVARELGLRVPEDVIIVGIGDAAQSAQAGISSVGAVDMRERIVDFVLARAEDPGTPANRLLELEPKLFQRRSTER